MKKKTAVRKMYDAFTEGNWHTMNYTREKASHVRAEFWFLLISSGFAFEKADLIAVNASVDEGHYSLAVRCGNLTFAYAYEELRKRIPFIGIGLSYSSCWPSFSNHATQAKSAGRLVIGTRFIWEDEQAKVTSFKDDKNSLVACAYYPEPENYTPSKIKKRFAITIADFKQEMSKRRKQLFQKQILSPDVPKKHLEP